MINCCFFYLLEQFIELQCISRVQILIIYFVNRIGTEGSDEFFTSYDEVYDSFDSMGLQENLLRGIYAYGT